MIVGQNPNCKLMTATIRAIESIPFEMGKSSSPKAVRRVVKIKGWKNPRLSETHPRRGWISSPPMKKILNSPAVVDSSIPFIEIK